MLITDSIEVVIADDNIFLAEALAENLNKHEDISVKKTFSDLNELILYLPLSSTKILILDINFNGTCSLDYVAQIKKENTSLKIIALTTLNNEFTREKALQQGIDFFKGKDSSYHNFDQCIRDCYSNDRLKTCKSSSSLFINGVRFTETKIKVLKALYDYAEETEIEIAKKLNISTSSLKTHKRQLYEMTNTKRVVDLIKFGLHHGILIH